jgi:hypothetical protein
MKPAKKQPVKARKGADNELRSGGRAIKTPLIKSAWASSQFFSHGWGAAKLLRDEGAQYYFTKFVHVLDGSPEAYEQMKRQIREAIIDNESDDAGVILAAIGTPAPARKAQEE